MSIFSPQDVLRRHAILPAICGLCNYPTDFPRHDAALDEALINSTCLHEAREELALLTRTVALFARFPESRYALEVNKEQLNPKLFPRTSSDPAFEAALATDPELSLFLRRGSFYLPARRHRIAQLVARLEEANLNVVGCPVCPAGVLRLPDGFFHNNGNTRSFVVQLPPVKLA